MSTRINPLEFRADCTNCYTHDVSGDDAGYWCEACGATWGPDGQDGQVAS